MEHQLGTLPREQNAIAGPGCSLFDLGDKVNSLEGRSDVGNNSGQTEVQSLLRDSLETERILDGFLNPDR